MSAAEEDTELRDMLIHNLDNSGVLNKLKAEMRAAVFLAMEEQEHLEKKRPMINENLQKCLSTEDGRLVAGLIVDFLQVFNLDFTLAVFQPEINTMKGLEGRDQVCKDLGLSEVNRNCPLLLELVKRRHRDNTTVPEEERITNARRKFDFHDKGVQDSEVPGVHEDRILSPPVSKDSSPGGADSPGLKGDRLDLDLEVEDDLEEGDSFFDDPLPKPQKTYGCLSVPAAEDERDVPPSEPRKSEASRDSRAESEAPRPGGGRGRAGGSGGASNSREKVLRESKDKTSSLHLDDDLEYDDDFNSHRSEFSKSELSIDEEIEEVSIEGPDSEKGEETTQDLSASQLSQSHSADYMEDVA